MIIGSTKQEYLLTAENIDLMSESIQEFLRSLKMNEKNILWIRLSMEEMLLKWQSHFGEECACLFFASLFCIKLQNVFVGCCTYIL